MSTRAATGRPMMVAVVLSSLLASGLDASEAPNHKSINDIGRYCTSCWRNARLPVDAWSDCTQEVLCRLLQRIPASRWSLALKEDSEERREFLRAIDAVKKRTQRAKRHSDNVDLAADPRDRQHEQLREEREAVRIASGELLGPRQQRIMHLSFDGWTVQQIADEMGLAVERISDEKYKAIRKLRTRLMSQERD